MRASAHPAGPVEEQNSGHTFIVHRGARSVTAWRADMTDVMRSTVSPAYSAVRSTADSGIPIVGAMGENIGRLGVCILMTGDDRPVGQLGQHTAAGVDRSRRQLGASVVATPPPGRGVGHHTMRGVPPEPEQRCPKRLVGGQDPALVLGMRTRFIGQQEPCPRHHASGPAANAARVSSAAAIPPARSTGLPRAISSARGRNVSAGSVTARCARPPRSPGRSGRRRRRRTPGVPAPRCPP